MPFKGCIKDVQLGTLVKDLNENVEFKDMSPGCTEVAASVLSTDHPAVSLSLYPIVAC